MLSKATNPRPAEERGCERTELPRGVRGEPCDPADMVAPILFFCV